MSLVECIPNVSEGRRADVVDACASAIRGAGAALLDIHTDPDHNRSVFSFAGVPAVVSRAALALFDVAISRIDLSKHRGVHPRMGAVDVMPFVPLSGFTIEEAAALAESVGRAAADRHQLPVYLYEFAALDAARVRLEEIRRGEFEGLAARMARPGWAPDFGPREPHPSAGVVAIGARWPLIAFNVVLDTDQIEVAQAIARAIRERDGGLPAVKALGLSLATRKLVQVSLNLTDYRRTPPAAVLDRIIAEAERLGVSVKESELVGLAPAAALPPNPLTRLRLARPSRNYALETALATAGLQE